MIIASFAILHTRPNAKEGPYPHIGAMWCLAIIVAHFPSPLMRAYGHYNGGRGGPGGNCGSGPTWNRASPCPVCPPPMFHSQNFGLRP